MDVRQNDSVSELVENLASTPNLSILIECVLMKKRPYSIYVLEL